MGTLLLSHQGPGGYLGESAITFIVVEHIVTQPIGISGDVGHKQGQLAVIIVISPGDPRCGMICIDSRDRGDAFECSVSAIMVKKIAGNSIAIPKVAREKVDESVAVIIAP